MKKDQLNSLMMLLATKQCFITFQMVVDAIAELGLAQSGLNTRIGQIYVQYDSQNISLKGITDHKNKVKARIIKQDTALARALLSFANKTDNSELAAEVNFRKGQLDKMREVTLRTVTDRIIKLANDHVADLSGWDVDLPQINALETDQVDFVDYIPRYRNAVARKKNATARIEELLRGTKKWLKDEVDPLMDSLAPKYPDFYGQYRTSRAIVDYGLRHALNDALTGQVTSKNDSAPIRGIRVHIPALNRTALTTGGGNYHFPVAPDGSYAVEFTGPNFKKLVVNNVPLLKGQPTVLSVQMQYAENLLDVPDGLRNDAALPPSGSQSQNEGEGDQAGAQAA